MAGPATSVATGAPIDARTDVLRESITMALYITVSLLAVLVAVPSGAETPLAVLSELWGTTVGLTIAHLLAFRLSGRLVGAGDLAQSDAAATAGQAVAAALVAMLASIPLLFTDADSALDLSRLLLAGFVGVCAYAVGRNRGGTRVRAYIYSVAMMLVAMASALLKNALAGH